MKKNKNNIDWNKARFHWPPVYEEPAFFEDIRNFVDTVRNVSFGLYLLTREGLIELGKVIGGGVKRGVMYIQNINGDVQPRVYLVPQFSNPPSIETHMNISASNTTPMNISLPQSSNTTPINITTQSEPIYIEEENVQDEYPKYFEPEDFKSSFGSTQESNPKPTHFEDDNYFQYDWKGKSIRIGNVEADELIEAYEILQIDIVRVILDKHQLVDWNFVKKRYRRLQKQFHPDKGGETFESAAINIAFEKIKNIMTPNGESDQMDLISRVLLYHEPKAKDNSGAYLFLFSVGATTTLISFFVLKYKK